MAACRNGIKTVIIPADNGRDLDEIDQTVRKALQFVLVERADQVLSAALLPHISGTDEHPELLMPVTDKKAPRLRQ